MDTQYGMYSFDLKCIMNVQEGTDFLVETSSYILLSRVLATTDGVLGSMIGFIDTLYTLFGTTGNYSAIADLHTSQFTVHSYTRTGVLNLH
jgi:hypothetical protein